jgi:hypothetical protein
MSCPQQELSRNRIALGFGFIVGTFSEPLLHREIRFIEGNAKCRHLKKVTRKGTLRQLFICLRPPPPVCTYIPIPVLIHTGKGGVLTQRKRERGNRAEHRSQSWVENMTESTQEISYLQSMNSDKHLPQSPYFSYAAHYLSYAAPCLSYAGPYLSYAAPYLSYTAT